MPETVRAELASPYSSITRRLGRRIFAEDTPPASSAALERADLGLAVIWDAAPRAGLVPFPRSSVPDSNRQRAP